MNQKKLKQYYRKKYKIHGATEESLGWTKGKQLIRFFQLTRHFSLKNSRLLDVGCGFGDFHQFLNQEKISLKKYTGIDLIPEFIEIAKSKYGGATVDFILADYLSHPDLQCDFVIGSGIFGHQTEINDAMTYLHISKVIGKAFREASVAVSFDFISDKTDYRTSDKDFHASPSKILELGYSLTKNLLLDNSAMPFEFSITLFKNDRFVKEKTVFNRFLDQHAALL